MTKKTKNIFFTLFVPGKLQGKQRPRKGKHGFYTPKATKRYERMVGFLAKAEMMRQGKTTTQLPISLSLTVFYKIPTSWSKSKKQAAQMQRIKPTTKPDIDNVQKIIMDALNGVLYQDDRQIVKIESVEKRYAKEPGVHIFARVI